MAVTPLPASSFATDFVRPIIPAFDAFNAAQALEFRRPARTSPELEQLVADYRRRVPFIDNDEVMYPHIAASVEFLRER